MLFLEITFTVTIHYCCTIKNSFIQSFRHLRETFVPFKNYKFRVHNNSISPSKTMKHLFNLLLNLIDINTFILLYTQNYKTKTFKKKQLP